MQVRPPMNDKRKRVIREAFAKMDKTGDGSITVDDMMGTYKVDRHPQYQSGELTKEEILTKFLGNFEGPSGNKDGKVRFWGLKTLFREDSMQNFFLFSFFAHCASILSSF